MTTVLTDDPGVVFEPDLHIRQALMDRLPSPVPVVIAGPKRAYDINGAGVPHAAVFVSASGGGQSRPIRGGPNERRVSARVLVRSRPGSSPHSFRDGQQLARNCHDVLDQRPMTGYCELRAVNSHPEYMGQDTDSHHEWIVILDMTVDTTIS